MSGSVELDLWLHEYEEAALRDALKERGMTVIQLTPKHSRQKNVRFF